MFKVRSVYRRYMAGFGLAYETKSFEEPDLLNALARISEEIIKEDIKEVSLEDTSKTVKNVTDYPVYGAENQ